MILHSLQILKLKWKDSNCPALAIPTYFRYKDKPSYSTQQGNLQNNLHVKHWIGFSSNNKESNCTWSICIHMQETLCIIKGDFCEQALLSYSLSVTCLSERSWGHHWSSQVEARLLCDFSMLDKFTGCCRICSLPSNEDPAGSSPSHRWSCWWMIGRHGCQNEILYLEHSCLLPHNLTQC